MLYNTGKGVKDMAKRQNFVVGSTNSVTQTLTTNELNHGFDQYEILTADELDGVFNAVSDYSNDSSNEIANAIQSITGSQPTGATQDELASALQQMRAEIETTSLTFKGYVSTSAPDGSVYTLIEDNIWINSATMPTSFPVAASAIKKWDGSAWVDYGSTYTPADFDFFRNINDNEGYYWFGGMWTVMSTDMSTTYFVLNQGTGKWEIKSNVNLPGAPTTTTADSLDKSTKIATTQYVHDAGANYVSNCITEIPQDIKLELSSGTLTLKSGSRVYIPDGSGVFNTYLTTNDISATFSTDGTYLVGFAESFGNITTYLNAISGGTQPTTLTNGLTWYDTTNNVIKRAWANAWQDSLFSLPLCLITVSGGQITSIDKVFNGFGYIGSTMYSLPGVKALIPNGRNADGTLKNTAFTVSSVLTNTSSSTDNKVAIRLKATEIATGDLVYDEINNYNKLNDGSLRQYAVIGSLSRTSGVINSFETKTAFHAIDYNDFTTKQDKDSALNYDNISNCITEIPQDIHLTLSNGTLTLKAGSKVYLPNGTNTFTPKTFASDITRTAGIGMSCFEVALFDKSTLNFVQMFEIPLSKACSGSTDTLSGTPQHIWYDTTNNLIKYYGSDGTTNSYYTALPHAIISGDNSKITSIDQVFNGFGYIASTMFVLPGVQGLISNGKNTDGTLKNTNLNIAAVRTQGAVTNANYELRYYGITASGSGWSYATDYIESATYPGVLGYPYFWYNSEKNFLYNVSSTGNIVNEGVALVIKIARDPDDGHITSLNHAEAFHAVSYESWNEHRVVKFIRPTSSNGYKWARVYSDGWVEQGGSTDPTENHPTVETISLVIPMADARYTLCVSHFAPAIGTGGYTGIGWKDKTTTEFKTSGALAGTGNGNNFDWYVCGMAAKGQY